MPPIVIDVAELAKFGAAWQRNGENLSRTPPFSSGDLGRLIDMAVGRSLAVMLGGVPIVSPSANALTAPQADCVEVGPVRIVGGVRPQNFDVGYRPDGVRFAFDSKTLNDKKSVGKNWQNMVNDLATEATTVHSRFPHAIVAFVVAVPEPCLGGAQRTALVETLERLARRTGVEGSPYMAEAITLLVWKPADGSVSDSIPQENSPLRLENFAPTVETVYRRRYKGLPPHTE